MVEKASSVGKEHNGFFPPLSTYSRQPVRSSTEIEFNKWSAFETDVFYKSSNTFHFECADKSYVTNLNKAAAEFKMYYKELVSLFEEGEDDLWVTSNDISTDLLSQLQDPYDFFIRKLKTFSPETFDSLGSFFSDLHKKHLKMKGQPSSLKIYLQDLFFEGKRENKTDKEYQIKFEISREKIHITFSTLMTYGLENKNVESHSESLLKKHIKELLIKYSSCHAQKLNLAFYQMYEEYCKLEENVRRKKDLGRSSMQLLAKNYKADRVTLNEGKRFYETSILRPKFKTISSECKKLNYTVPRGVAARGLEKNYKKTVFFFAEETEVDGADSNPIPQKEYTRFLNDPYNIMSDDIKGLLKDITVEADAYLLKIDKAHKLMENQLIALQHYSTSYILFGKWVRLTTEDIFFTGDSMSIQIYFQSLLRLEDFQKLSIQSSLTPTSRQSLQKLGKWIGAYSSYHAEKLRLSFYQSFVDYCDSFETYQKRKNFMDSHLSLSEDVQIKLLEQVAHDEKIIRDASVKINNGGENEMEVGSQVAADNLQSHGPHLNLNLNEKHYVTFPLMFNKHDSNPIQCSGTVLYNDLKALFEKLCVQHYRSLFSTFKINVDVDATKFNSILMDDAKQTESLNSLIRQITLKSLRGTPKETDNKLILEIEKTLQRMIAQVDKANEVFYAFFYQGKMEVVNDIENEIYFDFLEKSITVHFLPLLNSPSLKEIMNNDLFSSYEGFRDELVTWFGTYTVYQQSKLKFMFYQKYADYCLFFKAIEDPEKIEFERGIREVRKNLGSFITEIEKKSPQAENVHQEGASGGELSGGLHGKKLNGKDLQSLLVPFEEMEKSLQESIASTSTEASGPFNLNALKGKYLILLDQAKSLFDKVVKIFPEQETTTSVSNIQRNFQSLKNTLRKFAGKNSSSKKSSGARANLIRNIEVFGDSLDFSENKNKKKWE